MELSNINYTIIRREVMKRRYSIIALLLVFAMTLIGCGANNAVANEANEGTNNAAETAEAETTEVSETDEEVTITFMNYSSSGANEESLTKMVEAFESQNENIKVEVQTYGFDDYFQVLTTTVAGGTTPDVFELNIENFRAYADKGVIAKIEGVDTSEIHPKTLEAFSIDGDQYGLPTKFSNVVMIYNKDLFDQAGVDYPTADWTWGEELAAAQAIRALGDDYFGVYRPIQTWEFYKTVAQNGGSMMNADQSEFTINSSENIEALEMMIARVNDTNVTPNLDQLGGMGDWDLFKSGRLGMIVTGIWAFGDFTENCDFNWDVAVEPGINEKATHFFSDAIVVSEDSAQKEAATKFAAFISGSTESAKIRLDANWDLPVVLTDEITESYLAVTPPENKQAVIDSLDYLVMPPSLENFNVVADILGGYLDEAVAGLITAEEALNEAQAELEMTQ
jgi:multiple sugar transport system substrate-binding protein